MTWLFPEVGASSRKTWNLTWPQAVRAAAGSRRFKVAVLNNHSMFFLWTITLYHSTLSLMPTDRPEPVSINPSPPTIFSFPSILRLSPPTLFFPFCLLLCLLLSVLPRFFFTPLSILLLPLNPAPSLVSHAGLWPSYWPGRLFSNVLPDQSRLWNSPESSNRNESRIKFLIHSSTGTQATSVQKQVDSFLFQEVKSFRNRTDRHFSGPERSGDGVLDSAPVGKLWTGWCRSLYCRTLHIRPHTAMLYSAMLTVPRGKYCAELQAQCHVKTGPDRVRTGPDLDQTRVKNNLELSCDRTGLKNFSDLWP